MDYNAKNKITKILIWCFLNLQGQHETSKHLTQEKDKRLS